MPNHFHGIIELVGVPLVGTPNDGNTHFANQPQNGQSQTKQSPIMGQPSIMGQQNVGVPLVGTPNDGNTHSVEQSQSSQSPQTQTRQLQMGQLSIMGQPQGIAPTVTVGNVVGAFKSLSTNEYIKNVRLVLK